MAAIKGKNTKPEMLVRIFYMHMATGTGYTIKDCPKSLYFYLYFNFH
jgi:hypothetical protein